MEVLSCLINRVVEGNYLSSSRIADGRGEELAISHLLYVNDKLLFCEADKDQLKFLSWTLMWFEAMSGLKINLTKAKLSQLGSWLTWRSWPQNWDVKLDPSLRPTWAFP